MQNTLPPILIVDDEELVRILTSEYLEEQGYHTVCAANGQQALQIFHSQNLSLVLLDLRMPGLDGHHVLKKITAENPELPVVVISGTDVIQEAVQAIRFGAWDYITKPFHNLDVLNHAVRKALERGRLIRENRLYREHLEEEVQKQTAELRKEIARRKQVEAKLRKSQSLFKELSRRDDLTGLFNSRHFHAQIEVEVERSNRYTRNLSMIFMDIDKFKNFNDQYGHLKGDRVLAVLGDLIRKFIRGSDSGYRYGGEEFVSLHPETHAEEAFQVAERLRKAFEAIIFSPDSKSKVSITLSLGVAQYKFGETCTQFIARADTNMYTAKKNGRNRTIFSN